jgi:dihydroorotase
MPLLVHGEVTDPAVDVFDREAVFIERVLLGTLRRFPALRIVFEHVTTRDAAELVTSGAFPNLAATITPQHLMLNRNALFDGGLRPHAYCLPVVKREEHRLAVRKAAVSGSPNVFLGTDSAPHDISAKESGCGCAGLFNAPFAIEAYAQVFDEEGALDLLEGFASEHGPRFYGLPLNEERITLERGGVEVPAIIDGVVPFGAGRAFGWRLAG